MTHKTEELLVLTRAVLDFAAGMLGRLQQKVDEGYTGWDEPENIPSSALYNALCSAVERQRWLDAANYAMFLWRRRCTLSPDEAVAVLRYRSGHKETTDHPQAGMSAHRPTAMETIGIDRCLEDARVELGCLNAEATFPERAMDILGLAVNIKGYGEAADKRILEALDLLHGKHQPMQEAKEKTDV